jgi:hypothetical protein
MKMIGLVALLVSWQTPTLGVEAKAGMATATRRAAAATVRPRNAVPRRRSAESMANPFRLRTRRS